MVDLFFTLFVLATFAQLYFWGWWASKLVSFSQKKNPTPPHHPVSVIICARNEAQNLKKHLPLILNQNYRSFEVIVVNDNSTDETATILLNFQIKNPTLRVVNICDNPTLPGKKQALTKGIEAAQNDLILLTDADCFPASDSWIFEMQSEIFGKKSIVLGFSPYICINKGILNSFIRFEAIYTAVQYLSFALSKMPYMGVGRNLLYRKSIFIERGAFVKHIEIASGDDDLFVNDAASWTNTSINLSPNAFTYSLPKSSWRGYYHQKTRHLTTGIKYKLKHQLLLGGLALSHFVHYVFGFCLLFVPDLLSSVIFLILVRIGLVVWLYRSILNKLNQADLWPWVPIFDASLILYYILFAPNILIGNKKKWKQ